jgi:hypothetical protein
MAPFQTSRLYMILYIFFTLHFNIECVVPTAENIFEYNLLKLKSFWKGKGSAIAYPGKILLTSEKLKEQRGHLSSIEANDFSDYFLMTIHLNFHINNKESRQSTMISLTNSNAFPDLFDVNFNLLPIKRQFSGVMIYIKNFDTMHVGTFESENLNENELLSRAKVCKISQRENGFFQFRIEYSLGKFTVQIIENQDGSFRPCAQFSSFKFNKPIYLSAAGADDFGFAETVISKKLFFNLN